MTVDDVAVNSSVGVDGNSYTTSISNDKLTNEDFLTLMLEEMKQQDPTEPMDSDKILEDQLNMSTIDSNMKMADSMALLQAAYENSALSSAAGLIGNVVENGEIGDDGLVKSYKVETVENIDGELYVNTRQLTGLYDNLVTVTDDETVATQYDENGYIYDDGEKTDIRVQLDENGNFVFDENNEIILLDDNDERITDEDITSKYKYNGSNVVYSEDVTTIAMSDIVKVR